MIYYCFTCVTSLITGVCVMHDEYTVYVIWLIHIQKIFPKPSDMHANRPQTTQVRCLSKSYGISTNDLIPFDFLTSYQNISSLKALVRTPSTPIPVSVTRPIPVTNTLLCLSQFEEPSAAYPSVGLSENFGANAPVDLIGLCIVIILQWQNLLSSYHRYSTNHDSE